jgi:hypothetical protein
MESSRPLACDFRRLRFSRNARFSRSCRGSFPGFFAGSLAWPPPLAFSSVIVVLWHDRRMDGSAKFMHWRLCRNERSRAGVALSPAAIAICWPGLCQYILCFTRPSCKRRSHGVPATLPTLTTVVRIFQEFQLTPQLHRQLPRRRAGISRQYGRRSARKSGTGTGRNRPCWRRPRPLDADFCAFCRMAGRSARLR